MKPRSPRYLRGLAAIEIVAIGAALIFVALVSVPAYAQDAGTTDSDWTPLDRVLVIPPVYKPAAKVTAPATLDLPPTSPDCAKTALDSGADGSIVVAGTADCAGTSNAVDPLAQGSSAAAGAAQQPQANSAQTDTAGIDPSVGTAEDYQQEQAAAEASAASGIGQSQTVVVGVPAVTYYLPRSYAPPSQPMTQIYNPSRTFPLASWMPQPTIPMVTAPPAWMPQPTVPMIAARPPIFIPPTFGSFVGR